MHLKNLGAVQEFEVKFENVANFGRKTKKYSSLAGKQKQVSRRRKNGIYRSFQIFRSRNRQ